jgi:hypothetical protein
MHRLSFEFPFVLLFRATITKRCTVVFSNHWLVWLVYSLGVDLPTLDSAVGDK